MPVAITGQSSGASKSPIDIPHQALVAIIVRHCEHAMHRAPSEAAASEPALTGAATLADEIASTQNGAGPLMGRIRKPDAREALAYVRAHSSTEGELLEGLSKFVERWLEQVSLHKPTTVSKAPSDCDCICLRFLGRA